jgi:hypothetical protein
VSLQYPTGRFVALSAIMLLVITSCASGQLLRTAEETAQAPAAPAAVVKADSYDAYDGARVSPGTPFKVIVDPVGVDEAKIIISVTKVTWRGVSLFETDDEETPKKAQVTLIVEHEEEFHTLVVQTSNATEVAGYKIHVLEAGEEYFEGTARWVPWARLQAEPVRR